MPPYIRMRKQLLTPPDRLSLPDNMHFVPFDVGRHPKPARELLNRAYRNGGGAVLTLEDWWEAVFRDEEFDQKLCFVIETNESELAGFLQCWNSGFIKDVAVEFTYRRVGLAKNIVNQCLSELMKLDLSHVDLKVERDNPHGAIAFYEALGFQEINEGL